MDSDDFKVAMPRSDLRPFVRRYIFANRRLRRPLEIHPKATGYINFANCFGCRDGDFISVDGDRRPRRSRWHFIGQILDHDVVIGHESGVEWIACEFRATGFHRLFHVPGLRITGTVPSLGAVRPDLHEIATGVFTGSEEATQREHLREMDRFLASLADQSCEADAPVEAAVDMLEAASGAIRVADICKAIGVSQRHLNRRFSEIVGVGPKLFGQILQINRVVGLLYAKEYDSLTQLAHDAGFYDQAHFNRAMRRFFSEGPRDFLNSEHVAFETFLGASDGFGR